MKATQIIVNDYQKIIEKIDLKLFQNALIVCDKFFLNSMVLSEIKKHLKNVYIFDNYSPNPKYEEVLKGLEVLTKHQCDLIISLGGGSTIDVAKCIKAFYGLDEKQNYLGQKIVPNNIKHMAIPTSAGTGSESTKFAVLYYNKEKYSVSSDIILPNYVLLESRLLESLPIYQKKSTMLDALCQGIESFWSLNSTAESKKYAQKAIRLILKNYRKYIEGNKDTNKNMLKAANYSGRAINISQTTAAHALSYKITSLYGISHGHAVAICLPHIWKYMLNNLDKTVDSRGKNYIESIFTELDNMFECESHEKTITKFNDICSYLGLEYNHVVKESDLNVLTKSVNTQRLKNNPISLDETAIENIYQQLI